MRNADDSESEEPLDHVEVVRRTSEIRVFRNNWWKCSECRVYHEGQVKKGGKRKSRYWDVLLRFTERDFGRLGTEELIRKATSRFFSFPKQKKREVESARPFLSWRCLRAKRG